MTSFYYRTRMTLNIHFIPTALFKFTTDIKMPNYIQDILFCIEPFKVTQGICNVRMYTMRIYQIQKLCYKCIGYTFYKQTFICIKGFCEIYFLWKQMWVHGVINHVLSLIFVAFKNLVLNFFLTFWEDLKKLTSFNVDFLENFESF